MASKQQELVFKLKFQARMLENQAKREMKNAEKERRLARSYLAKGQRPLALLHAQNSTRAAQFSTFLAENSGRVQGMACDVQMAQVQKSTAEALGKATKEMERYINDMNLEKIAAMAVKYDQIRGKTQQAHAIMMPDDATMQMNADALLGDLETEIEQEVLTGGALDIPTGAEYEMPPDELEAAPA
jgi:charged multivesicular body protein 1